MWVILIGMHNFLFLKEFFFQQREGILKTCLAEGWVFLKKNKSEHLPECNKICLKFYLYQGKIPVVCNIMWIYYYHKVKQLKTGQYDFIIC